jgi:RNA polymerase I-specific transcription initiation factor RRN7
VKCLQLILRHQVAYLIQKKGLPAELESVVRDLWTLRILQLGHKIRNESQDSGSSQVFSTQESETEAEDDPLVLQSRKKKLQENPTLIDCLALCYLGTLTLRLPVTPGDIYTWTTEEDMPYLNAIRLITPPMRNRLPATYHSAFSPYTLLNLKRFYTAYANLLAGLELKYSIAWPALNVPVILFRYLKDLALPLELYDATMRLGEKLGYDFALYITPRQRLNIASLPEARLISCLVVCVKLIFPFDDTKRHPRSVTEPAATAIDWPAWSRLIKAGRAAKRGGEQRYTMEELTRVEEKDVLSMSGGELDEYLDFYLANFVDEMHIQSKSSDDAFQAAMYNLFPVASDAKSEPQNASTNLQHEKKLELVRAVHGTIKEVRAIADDEGVDVLRPGAQYVEYTKESNMPPHAARFYEEAARVSGLTLDMLGRCVRHIERKIAREQGRRKHVESHEDAEQHVGSVEAEMMDADY